MWRRSILDPIYKQDITVLVGPFSELNAYLRKHFDEDTDVKNAGAKTFLIEHEDRGFTDLIVWFPKWSETDGDLCKLVHESLHVTYETLRYRRFTLNDDTEEAYTYFQEYVFRTLMGMLRAYDKRESGRNRKRSAKRKSTRSRSGRS